MKRWLPRALVAALLILFLIYAPPMLREELERDPYAEILRGEEETGWGGVLKVWHVVDFKTAQGSVTSYLESCAAKYEKQHDRVYIEVTGLSPGAVRERLLAGEYPDIWSIPLSALTDVGFAPLSLQTPALAEGLHTYGLDGRTLALPYLYSGYFLMSHTVLTQELGLSFPDTAAFEAARAGQTDALSSHLQAAMDSKATARHGAISAPVLLAAQWNLTGTLSTDGDFNAKQTPFLAGDARTYGDLQRKTTQGGFTFDAAPLGGFTDQVQYLGLSDQMPAERNAHATGFVALLFEEEQQAKLTALGALPAVKLAEPPQYTDGMLQSFYLAYQNPVTPDPLAYASERSALLEAARTAVEQGERAAFEQAFAKIMGS